MPPLLKFLTAKNGLVYGRQPRCRFECIPPSSTQMGSRAASACHFPKNKPFLAETLKVEYQWRSHPRSKSAKLMLLVFLLLYPQLKARQLLLQFSRAIAKQRPRGTDD
jgi:hypothetical protein